MKLFSPLLAVLLALPAATALADPPVNPDFGNGHFVKTFPPATEKAWSVTGVWFVSHTLWSGPLTFKTDGLIYNPDNKLEGQWILTTQEGEVHLVIRWNKWTADNLSLVNGDQFYGCDGRSEIWLRRLPSASATASTVGEKPDGTVDIVTWHQGEPPVRLIRTDAGFCALTSVTGHFAGDGESVKVYAGDDGYWYLGGTSAQHGVAAECVVVHYRARDIAHPVKSADAVTPPPQ